MTNFSIHPPSLDGKRRVYITAESKDCNIRFECEGLSDASKDFWGYNEVYRADFTAG